MATSTRNRRIFDRNRATQGQQRTLEEMLAILRAHEARIAALEDVIPVEGRVSTDGSGGIELVGEAKGVRKVEINSAGIVITFSEALDSVRYKPFAEAYLADPVQRVKSIDIDSTTQMRIEVELSTSATNVDPATTALDYGFFVRREVVP